MWRDFVMVALQRLPVQFLLEEKEEQLQVGVEGAHQAALECWEGA